MKLGFTGARSGMTDAQRSTCRDQLKQISPSSLHHGDAIGADAEAHRLALELRIRTVVHPGNDEAQRAFCDGDEIRNPTEFMTRNRAIVDETDLILATPGRPENEAPRSGTWRTVRYAQRMGKQIRIILPNGAVELR